MNAGANAELDPQSSTNALLRTLVLCDLVDSTALVERLGDREAAELIRKHDRLARTLADRHGGQEIDTEKAELSRSLDSVLGQMSEREEKVLRMYYGINYAREFTLDEIGRELKLTRERVRQIKNRSLRKLLRSRESKEKLLPFVNGDD